MDPVYRTLLTGGRLDELLPDEILIGLLIEPAEGRKRKVLAHENTRSRSRTAGMGTSPHG